MGLEHVSIVIYEGNDDISISNNNKKLGEYKVPMQPYKSISDF